MTNLEHVQELMRTSEGQERFLQWSTDRMTQLMLGAAREMARPRGVKADGAEALMEVGATIRANELVDFLTLPGSGLRQLREHTPEPTYGAQEILKEMANG